MFLLPIDLRSQEKSVTLFTEEDGLANNDVRDVTKDEQGYLWIATGNGLSKFDGAKFINFNKESGLPGNMVWAVAHDQMNRIYVGCYKSGLAVIENDKVVKVLHLNGKPNNKIRKLFYSSQHHLLLAGTDFGLYALKDTTFYLLSYPNGPDAQSSILAMTECKGTIYFTDFTNDPLHGSGGLFKVEINDEDISKSKTTSVIRGDCGFGCTASDNAVYFSLRFQVFKYNPETDKIVEIIKTDQQYIAWSMAFMKSKKVILGGIREDICFSGIKVVDAETKQVSKYPFIVAETSVNAISVDQDENLTWFCTDNGLYCLKESPFIVYNKVDSTNILDVKVIADSLYVMTENHVWQIRNGQWVMIYNAKQLDRAILDRYVAYCRNGRITDEQNSGHNLNPKNLGFNIDGNQTFVVTYSGAVSFPDMKTYYPSNRINFVTRGDGKVIWIPNYNDMLYYKDIKSSQKPVPFPIQGRPVKDILKIIKSGDTIYFASYFNGLYAMVGDHIYYLNPTNSKLDNLLTGMDLDSKKEIWCTSKDGNLFHVGFKDSLTVLQTFNKHNTKIVGSTYKWLAFNKKHLYVGTNKGLNRINVSELQRKTIDSVHFFNQYNGYENISADSPVTDSEGNVYVFNLRKVIRIADQQIPSFHRKIIYSHISADNVIWDIKYLNNNILPTNTKNIKIVFGVVRLPVSKNIIYKYRINESEWNEGNELFLQSLQPGEYHITCEADDLETSEVYSDSLVFSIEKPIWLKGWFILLVIMALIAVIYVIIHIRFVRLSRRKEEKAKLNNEIAELHIQSLQSQMNPHFIFNSLNSIQHFVLSNKVTEAADYLSTLSRLIRINLEHISSEVISFADEITFLNLFINIEKLRFKEALEFTVTCSIGGKDQVFLPPMLLQPLIENSIKYRSKSAKQVSIIRIDFCMDRNLLVATVTDNGIGRDRSNSEHQLTHKSMSLDLIRERLTLLNRKNGTQNFRILITDLFEDGKPAGTKVQIFVPQLNQL